jgi:hypothetical protein
MQTLINVDGYLKICNRDKIDEYIAESLLSSLSLITYITWRMGFYDEDSDTILWLNLFKVLILFYIFITKMKCHNLRVIFFHFKI